MDRSSVIKIKLNKFLSKDFETFLYELYLPIIGYKALFLYKFLLNNLDNNLKSIDLNEILIKCQMNMEDFLFSKKTLESIELIKTYKHHFNNEYIIELNKVLNPSEFLNNPLYKGLLFSSISKDEVALILSKYSINEFNEYDEISASFKDSFNVEFDLNTLNYGNSIKFINENIESNLIRFDIDKVKKYILDNSNLLEQVLTKEVLNKLYDLGVLYSLDESILGEIAIKGYTYSSNFNNSFNFEFIKNEIFSYLKSKKNYDKLVNIDSTQISGDTLLAKKIKFYKETSPRELLKSRQDGIEPVQADLNLIYYLNDSFGFSHEMITCLLEYVLNKKNNSLDSAYVSKIAATLKRKKCENVLDVYNALYLKPTIANDTQNNLKSNIEKTNNSLELNFEDYDDASEEF